MSRIFRIPSCNPSSLSPPPTASTSISETVNGSHQFKISGYTLSKGMGVGRYISSDTFMIGGYFWAIYFYPDGKSIEDNATYVSLFIALASEGTDVRALFELTLLDQSGKEKHKVHSHFGRRLESGPYTLKYRGSMCECRKVLTQSASTSVVMRVKAPLKVLLNDSGCAPVQASLALQSPLRNPSIFVTLVVLLLPVLAHISLIRKS